MKFTVREFIDAADEDELYKLQYDLSNGSQGLKKLVDDKIKLVENEPKRQCTVCGEDLIAKEGTYSLIFTHDKLKKKASFCAIDCMEFFVSKLKKSGEIENSERPEVKG